MIACLSEPYGSPPPEEGLVGGGSTGTYLVSGWRGLRGCWLAGPVDPNLPRGNHVGWVPEFLSTGPVEGSNPGGTSTGCLMLVGGVWGSPGLRFSMAGAPR